MRADDAVEHGDQGVAAYAAFGGLDAPKPLVYAADLEAARARA